jgi:hypothetical protein
MLRAFAGMCRQECGQLAETCGKAIADGLRPGFKCEANELVNGRNPSAEIFKGRCNMNTIVILVLLILLLGGGGYYGHSMYGGAGLGGVLGLVLLVVVVAWLVGGLRIG